jgi:O-antigen ligase
MLFLTICLLFAEHHTPLRSSDIDSDYLVAKQGGRFTREIAYIAMGLGGLIATYYALVVQRAKVRWNASVALFLGLLLGWTLFTLFWTDTPEITAKRLFVLGLMFLAASGVALSWTTTQILKFMALSSALQVAVGIAAEVLYGMFTPFSGDYRFGGTLTGNSQGYLCLICTLSAMCSARLKQPDRRLYQVIAAFGFIFLLLTRSRGGLLAFGLALVFYFYVTLTPTRKAMMILSVGSVVLLLIISGTGPKLIDFLDRGGEGAGNFTGREPLWEDLMTYVHQHPLAGYGYEGFWTVQRIDDISEDQGWSMAGAHSGYVEGLLELGWIGAILHTLALLVCMVAGVKLFRRTNDYVYVLGSSLCLVYLVGGFVEAILIVKASESSFIFAVLLCLLTARREDSARLPSSGRQSVISAAQEAPMVSGRDRRELAWRLRFPKGLPEGNR